VELGRRRQHLVDRGERERERERDRERECGEDGRRGEHMMRSFGRQMREEQRDNF